VDSVCPLWDTLQREKGTICVSPVAATTIEKYRILLKIGSALEEQGMPTVQLPQ
jgi:hypothetical protein